MAAYVERLDALRSVSKNLEDRKAETDTLAFFLSRSHALIHALGSPSKRDERHDFLKVIQRMMGGREEQASGEAAQMRQAADEDFAES